MGIDTVFHCAGIAHQSVDATTYQRINVDATLSLLQHAQNADVRRFVLLSSVKAIRGTDLYARSKRLCETELESFANDEMGIFIVRPALVYGAITKGNIAALITGVKRGMPAPPEIGGRNMIGRRDLVDLLIELKHSELNGLQYFNIADGEIYSTRRLYDAICAKLGKKTGVELPVWCWRLACAGLDIFRPGKERLFDKLFAEDFMQTSELETGLNWRPTTRFEDELAARAVSEVAGR